MNGPSSAPQPSNLGEGTMVKKTTKEKAPTWTPDEAEIGKKFLKALKLHSGTFNERKNLAANNNSVGSTTGYAGLAPGVLSFLSDHALKAKKQKADTKYLLDQQRKLAELKESHAEQMKNREWAQANTHPDDIDRVMAELDDQ